jgi:hypothetical protein
VFLPQLSQRASIGHHPSAAEPWSSPTYPCRSSQPAAPPVLVPPSPSPSTSIAPLPSAPDVRCPSLERLDGQNTGREEAAASRGGRPTVAPSRSQRRSGGPWFGGDTTEGLFVTGAREIGIRPLHRQVKQGI